MNRKIILASSSPRRIDMMRRNGYDPIIMPAQIEEALPAYISMEDAVMFLALKKGLWVEDRITNSHPDLIGSIIISADTVVYKDGILGKPENRQHAAEMLMKMKNTHHYVATGVSIIKAGQCDKKVFCDVTKVIFRDYTLEELKDYLDTDEPYDKAGAYAIQGFFSKYVKEYLGDFDTVVGFPWTAIEKELSK